MTPLRRTFALALAAIAIFPASPVVGKTPATSNHRNNHYVDDLKHQIAWARFPLRIAFVRNAPYTTARQQRACEGFDLWVEKTEGFIAYEVVDPQSRPDVTVRFDPTTNNGYTTTHFKGNRINRAVITLGVKRGGSDSDLAAIACHELGHALGIDGHSTERDDLMYPVHRARTPWDISLRDLNTLAHIYPEWNRILSARNMTAAN